MAKFIVAGASSLGTHVTRRRPESNIEQSKLRADRKAREVYQKYLTKILDGSCTEEDFRQYTKDLKRVTDDFTKSCIDSLRRPE